MRRSEFTLEVEVNGLCIYFQVQMMKHSIKFWTYGNDKDKGYGTVLAALLLDRFKVEGNRVIVLDARGGHIQTYRVTENIEMTETLAERKAKEIIDRAKMYKAMDARREQKREQFEEEHGRNITLEELLGGHKEYDGRIENITRAAVAKARNKHLADVRPTDYTADNVESVERKANELGWEISKQRPTYDPEQIAQPPKWHTSLRDKALDLAELERPEVVALIEKHFESEAETYRYKKERKARLDEINPVKQAKARAAADFVKEHGLKGQPLSTILAVTVKYKIYGQAAADIVDAANA